MTDGDIFSEAFSQEGFAQAYSRKLKPLSRAERVAGFEAARSDVKATQRSVLQSMGLGSDETLETAAEAAPAKAGTPDDRLREFFRSMTDGQRASAQDMLIELELEDVQGWSPDDDVEWVAPYDGEDDE